MDNVLKIQETLADELRDVADEITEASSERALMEGEQEVDSFYSVGYVDHGQITDHQDTRLYIIREGNQYYGSSYDVGRDGTPNCWADTTEEDDETFVVFVPLHINYVTRIDWVRGS